MSDTMQSLDQLSQLKPAAPEAPKYVKKVDKYGRDKWVEFIKPADVPEREAYKWLSRGLEEAVLEFIGQAKGKGWGLRAAVYEFEYAPVIQAFVDALESGADVRIVYDAKQSGKDKAGPWKATLKALRQVGEDLQRAAARHLPFIPLGQIFTPVAHRSSVTGLLEMPIPVLWNVAVS